MNDDAQKIEDIPSSHTKNFCWQCKKDMGSEWGCCSKCMDSKCILCAGNLIKLKRKEGASIVQVCSTFGCIRFLKVKKITTWEKI